MISKYTGFQLVGGTRGIPLIKWKMVLSLPLSPPTVLPQNCWFCNYHAFFGHFAHDALTIWTLIGNPNIWWYSLCLTKFDCCFFSCLASHLNVYLPVKVFLVCRSMLFKITFEVPLCKKKFLDWKYHEKIKKQFTRQLLKYLCFF